MSQRVNLHLEDAFAEEIKAQKPKSLALSAFCALLIERGLDRVDTLGKPSLAQPEAGEGFTSSKDSSSSKKNTKKNIKPKEADPFSSKKLPDNAIPFDLLDCQQLLAEFWEVKKGTRSERVFHRVCQKLKQWTPDQRREALEKAIASGWGDVFEPQRSSVNSKESDARLIAEMDAMPSLW